MLVDLKVPLPLSSIQEKHSPLVAVIAHCCSCVTSPLWSQSDVGPPLPRHPPSIITIIVRTILRPRLSVLKLGTTQKRNKVKKLFQNPSSLRYPAEHKNSISLLSLSLALVARCVSSYVMCVAAIERGKVRHSVSGYSYLFAVSPMKHIPGNFYTCFLLVFRIFPGMQQHSTVFRLAHWAISSFFHSNDAEWRHWNMKLVASERLTMTILFLQSISRKIPSLMHWMRRKRKLEQSKRNPMPLLLLLLLQWMMMAFLRNRK